MRSLPAFALLSLFSSLPLDCSAQAPLEDTALHRFESQLKEVNDWSAKRTKELKGDLKSKFTIPKEILAKLRALETGGLPTDLTSKWSEYLDKVDAFADVAGKINPDGNTSAVKELFDDPPLMKEFRTTASELSLSAVALKKVFDKYGVKPPLPN